MRGEIGLQGQTCAPHILELKQSATLHFDPHTSFKTAASTAASLHTPHFTLSSYGNRGVTALAFSPDGTKLAAVCTDNYHTLYLWDWQRKQLLAERRTYQGTPPATYGLVWSPFEPSR